jgi:RNA polymerase sigma-70 factor (ECF subfamily)
MTADEPSTEQLVHGAQAGDAAAREALFARYLPRVCRMVAAHLGMPRAALPAGAEDIAQAAIVRALGALDRFEMRSGGAFAAWMATIVLNCVRRHQRDAGGARERTLWQRYGDLNLHDSIFRSEGPSPSAIIGNREDSAKVEQALLDLPALYREALTLRCIGQLSYAELAQQLGRTEVSCRKLVQRAMEMLQAALARRG